MWRLGPDYDILILSYRGSFKIRKERFDEYEKT